MMQKKLLKNLTKMFYLGRIFQFLVFENAKCTSFIKLIKSKDNYFFKFLMLINNFFWIPVASRRVPMKSPLVLAVGRLEDRSVGG